MPIFGMVTRKSSARSPPTSNDRLPYPLSSQQLDAIHQEYRKPLDLTQQDDLLCTVISGQPH
ncbi:hypothetical protein EIO60_00501|nr:hypothetical protein [Candidatus Pantoea persica]